MCNIKVYGHHEENTLRQIRTVAADENAVAAVLCADGHLGYNMPIGGVVAYRDAISPAGVGFDIACGNKAVRLDVTFDDIEADLPKIAQEVFTSLSFGVGRSNAETVDHELFEDPVWWDLPVYLDNPKIHKDARNQLGTIGSGNHYCDIFCDEQGRIWVGVHFGSRGLGHRTATYFMEAAGGQPQGNMEAPPVVIDTKTELGADYIAAMKLAGRYAYAGRDWVCAKIASFIGAPIVEEVHNHHNFAWQERHLGEEVWVVRKGATPAFPGQRGFVGGSMGDDSVILEGLASPDSGASLNSTVHGAGRVMSRTQAAGKKRWVGGKAVRISDGLVNMELVREQIAKQGTILMGAGADEAPEVYRRLPEVLAEHAGTIRVLHTLTPLVVCMADDGTFDPFKD